MDKKREQVRSKDETSGIFQQIFKSEDQRINFRMYSDLYRISNYTRIRRDSQTWKIK